MFQTDKPGNDPQDHSGKAFTFEKAEVSLLSSLRKWSTQYFKAHDGVTKDMYKALNKTKCMKDDFDVVAKVT